MNNNQNIPSSANQPGGSINPFARALFEAEKRGATQTPPNEFNSAMLSNPLLGQAGRNFDKFDTPDKSYQEILAKQKQKEALRQAELNRVNPTDQLREAFNSAKHADAIQLKSVREQLVVEAHIAKSRGADVQSLQIELSKEITDPGLNGGSYYHTLLDTFGSYIKKQLDLAVNFISQSPKSSSAWGATHNRKQSKRSKFSTGIDMSNGTKSAQELMHHEVSAAYSG